MDNHLYYTIENAVVTLKDGTIYKGKCKITRRDINENPQQGNILDLTSADFGVTMNTPEGEKTTKLSKIAEIQAVGKKFVVEKWALYLSEFEGKKIAVYKRIISTYADDISAFFYKKPDGKLETAPLLGKDKWYKNYFSDCPTLLTKVNNKELTTVMDIAVFYENCN
jgi:hypothetical protein